MRLGSHAMALEDEPGFDLSDFLSRWQRARMDALASSGVHATAGDFRENVAILDVPVERRESVLRAVFECSRKLGRSLALYLGIAAEPEDIRTILVGSGIGCFSGNWSGSGEQLKVTRFGCERPARADSFFCDYWREAADGLVMGLGDEMRFWRHRSLGRGNDLCMDVISPTPDEASRWERVPEEVVRAVGPVRERLARSGVELSLKGTSEGALIYSLSSSSGPLCGPGGKLIHDSFAREVASRCDGLRVQDASPLAVYGGAT